MSQLLLSYVIALAVTYPVAMNLMDIGGKPVDIVLSDALYLIVLLTPTRRMLTIPAGVNLKRLATVRVAATACVVYGLGLSLVGYAGSVELGRVISAVKFVKPMTFVLVGTYLAMLFPPMLLLRRVGVMFAVVVVITMATTVSEPYFPRSRWGQHFFGWDVYGFPNAPMTFYGVMVPLLLACGDVQRRLIWRTLFRGVALMAMLLVVASLSRSSALSMILAIGVYLALTGRIHIPVTASVVVGLLVLAGFGLARMKTDSEWITTLQESVENRLSQTVDTEDPLSGRIAIWENTIELSSDKPIFGYSFEPYSNYSRVYDTPHQQYLEVLYKTGLVGLGLYLWLLIAGVNGLLHMRRNTLTTEPAYFLVSAVLAGVVGTLIGNLSQPNLTYSLTGNSLFLLVGLLTNRQGAAGLIEETRRPTTVPSADRFAEKLGMTGTSGGRRESSRRVA